MLKSNQSLDQVAPIESEEHWPSLTRGVAPKVNTATQQLDRGAAPRGNIAAKPALAPAAQGQEETLCVEAAKQKTSPIKTRRPRRHPKPALTPAVSEQEETLCVETAKQKTSPKTSTQAQRKRVRSPAPTLIAYQVRPFEALRMLTREQIAKIEREGPPALEPTDTSRFQFSDAPRKCVFRTKRVQHPDPMPAHTLVDHVKASKAAVVGCAIKHLRIPNPPLEEIDKLPFTDLNSCMQVLQTCRRFTRSERRDMCLKLSNALQTRFERWIENEHLLRLAKHRAARWNNLPQYEPQMKDHVRGLEVAKLRGDADRVAAHFLQLRPSDQASARNIILRTRSLGKLLRLERAFQPHAHVHNVQLLLGRLCAKIRWYKKRQEWHQREESTRTDHANIATDDGDAGVVENHGISDFVIRTATKIGEGVDWAIEKATDMIMDLLAARQGASCMSFRPHVLRLVRFVFVILAPATIVTSGVYLLLRSWFKRPASDVVEYHGPDSIGVEQASLICDILNKVFSGKFFNNAGALARSFTNIVSAAKSMKEVFHTFMEYVCRTVFRTTYLGDDNIDDFIVNSALSLRQVMNYVQPLFEYENNEKVYVTLIAKRDLTRVTYAMRLIARARAYVAASSSQQHKMTYVARALEGYAKELDNALSGIANGVSLRAKPVVLYLVGAPGSGKSSCRDPVLQAAYAKLSENTREHAFCPGWDVFAKDKKSDFWAGYNNQRCLYIDDFLQVKDAQLRVAEFQTLFDVYNSDNCALNMAALDDKGNRYFTSELIYITSNVRHQEFSKYVDESAIMRRLHVYAEVERENRHSTEFDPRAVHYDCTIRRGDTVEKRRLDFDAFATLVARMIAYERRERDRKVREYYSASAISQEDQVFITDMFGPEDDENVLADFTAPVRIEEPVENHGLLFDKLKQRVGSKLEETARRIQQLPPRPRPSTPIFSWTRTQRIVAKIQVMLRIAREAAPHMGYNRLLKHFVCDGLAFLIFLFSPIVDYQLGSLNAMSRTALYGEQTASMATRCFDNASTKIALLGAAGVGVMLAFAGILGGLIGSIVRFVAAVVEMIRPPREKKSNGSEVLTSMSSKTNVRPPTIDYVAPTLTATLSEAQSGAVVPRKNVASNHSSAPISRRNVVKNHTGGGATLENATSERNLARIDAVHAAKALPGCTLHCPDCGTKITCSIKNCTATHEPKPCDLCLRWRNAAGLTNAGTLTTIGTRYVSLSVVDGDDRVFTSQYGLDIGQRNILSTRHFVECFQREYAADSSVRIRIEDADNNVYVADTRVMCGNDSDLGMIRAIGGTTRSKLTSRFVAENNLPRDNSFIFRSGPLDDGTCHHATFSNAFVVDNISRKLKCGVTQMQGRQGMCGTAYITLDKRAGAGSIIGLHFGGLEKNTKSAFAITTREFVSTLIDKLDERLGGCVSPAALADDYHKNALHVETVPGAYVNQSLCVSGASHTTIDVATHRFEQGCLPFEPHTAPADLSRQALSLGISGYGGPTRYNVHTDTYYEVINEIVHYWNRQAAAHPTGVKREVWNFEQGVNGIVDGNARRKYSDRLNPHTSAGFMFRDATQGKKAYIHFEGMEATWTRDLERTVHARLNAARKGEALPHCVITTLKDERRPLEKVAAKKTRVFALCQLDVNIAIRMLFGAFFEELCAHNAYAEVSVGLNMEDPCDVGGWYRTLEGAGEHWVAGDYQGWDKSISTALGSAFIEIVNRWYNDSLENQLARRTIGCAIFEADHLYQKVIFNRHRTMPSGIPGTAVANSVINSFIMRTVFRQCVAAPFDQHVQARYYGDDHVLRVSRFVINRFNQLTIAKYVKELFGMGYTDADKSPVYREETPSQELTYLKRSFHAEGELVYARLPMKVIDEIMLWSDNGEDYDANQSCVNSAFSFYRQYGRVFYEQQRARWRGYKLKHIYRIPEFDGFE